MDPRDKRLAVEVEDHPVSYFGFEGRISEGNYGAGEVRVWDSGAYTLIEPFDPLEQLEAGKLSFVLDGKQLCGEFTLVKLANRDKQWLLIKKNDSDAKEGWTLKTLLSEEDVPRRESKKKARVKEEAVKAPKAAVSENDYADVRGAETLRYRHSGKQVTVHGVERADMPNKIEPMLATLVKKTFVDQEWIFETKWDGVRAVAFIEDGTVRLISRSQQEMTFRYPEFANLAKQVRGKRVILDGEIVVFDPKGASRFQLLQQRIGVMDTDDIETRSEANPAQYCVFDVLYFDDYNLMPAPLLERKKLLRAILKENKAIRFSKHTVADGEKAFRAAERKNLEGIIAKHATSAYVQRRSSRWLKIKTELRQEVVIGGYTQPKGAREHFGALVVGVYRGDKLHYVGSVGGGFNHKSLGKTFELLQQYKRTRSPFDERTQPNERVQWLDPKLVAEVKFAEWTADRRMRQPIFVGLRDDKDPKQVHFEQEHETKKQVAKAERNARKTDKRRSTSKKSVKKRTR